MGKYENVIKEREIAKREVFRLEGEIESLKARKKEMNDKAEHAAEMGDDAGFLNARSEAAKVDDILYVREKQLEKASGPVSMEEAKEAWADYVSQRDKKITRIFDEYKKARHELFKQFDSLMTYQNETLAARKTLGECAGINTEPGLGDDPLSDFGMKMIERNEIVNDMNLFTALGEISRDKSISISISCNTRRPFK